MQLEYMIYIIMFCLLVVWILVSFVYVCVCFFEIFWYSRTNHNLYIPTISLIHSVFLCLMAAGWINYPPIQWPEVPHQKHGLVPWRHSCCWQQKNMMFQVIHCLCCLGVCQEYQTQSYLAPMQWENVEMILVYGFTFTIQLSEVRRRQFCVLYP